MSPISGAPLLGAASDALVRLAGERPELRVVVGRDPGPAAWFLDVWPDRVVVAPGTTSRLAVGDGVRSAGCTPVTVLDRDVVDLGDVVDRPGPHVLVTRHGDHLAAAYRARLVALQPAWEADVAPLLHAALAQDAPVLLRLHPGGATPPRGLEVAAPVLGQHRVLHRGSAGLVLGAGAHVALLADVARMLAGREVHVTAIEAHTLRPGTGIDPGLTDAHLLVGPVGAGQAEGLTPVPARPGDPRATMRDVLEALRR